MGVKRKVMTLINSPLQQEVVVWEGILDGDVQGWTVGAGACGGGYRLEYEVTSSSLSLSRSSSSTSSKSSSSSVAGMVWSMGGLGR